MKTRAIVMYSVVVLKKLRLAFQSGPGESKPFA